MQQHINIDININININPVVIWHDTINSSPGTVTVEAVKHIRPVNATTGYIIHNFHRLRIRATLLEVWRFDGHGGTLLVVGAIIVIVIVIAIVIVIVVIFIVMLLKNTVYNKQQCH